MSYPISTTFILIAILAASLVCDLRSRTIPNLITIPAMVLGIIINIMKNQVEGIKLSFFGILISFLILIIPFYIGGLGGGDVKLMMAVGALMGPWFALNALIYTAVAGALMALGIIIYQKKLGKCFSNIMGYLASIFLLQEIVPIDKEEARTYFPYGLAIGIGTLLTVFLDKSILLF